MLHKKTNLLKKQQDSVWQDNNTAALRQITSLCFVLQWLVWKALFIKLFLEAVEGIFAGFLNEIYKLVKDRKA